MIYNNYPDDYIVINAKWVEWDNDEQRWCFMTEDAFEKAQSLADYTKQVRKEVCEKIKKQIFNHFNVKNMEEYENLSLIDGLFTADAVIEMLDTILKEYQK